MNMILCSLLSGIEDFYFMDGGMRLRVNGEEYSTEKVTVMQLLREMEIQPERVAVEVNLRIVKRTDFENYSLKDGDSIEIVYFVGGGQKTNSKL